VSYSITRGTVVNVVAMKSEPERDGTKYDGPWVVDCTREELLENYAGWEPEVLEMLNHVEKPTRWAIHHLRPLPCYVADRVALLGDAAHAMAPHQGAGAGQAIEDAFVLAQLLRHPSATLSTLPSVLSAYEQVRLPFANSVAEGSAESGRLYEFYGSYGEDLQRLGQTIEHQWDWLHQSTPQSEVRKAVAVLDESIRSLSQQ